MSAKNDAGPGNPDLPEGWHEAPLATVADVRFSSVDKLAYPSEAPVRLCNYMDVYTNDYITADLPFMHASATQPEIDRFGIQVGDVIVTKDSETPYDIGRPAVVDYAAPDLVCGYHLALIRPDKRQIDPTFLAKQLGHDRIARFFAGRANGLTRYGLPIGAVTAAPLWLPPHAEQEAAGALLRFVDQALVHAELVIGKLKQIFTGLLHDLLTRGLDENGEARKPDVHPEWFQDSMWGTIPACWDITSVEQAGEVRLGRQRSPAHETGQHIRPYLRVANVYDCFIDYSDVLSMNFNPSEQETYRLSAGDILLNEGQSLELVGRSAIYKCPPDTYCFQNTLVRFRCNDTTIPEYCQAVFKYWLDIGAFTRIAKQTTSVAHLGADRFAKMSFPRPSLLEQNCTPTNDLPYRTIHNTNVQANRRLTTIPCGPGGIIHGYVPSSRSHAPAWKQVPTLQRRVRVRAAGAAKTAFPRGAWEREESVATGQTSAADTRPGVQGFSLGGGRTRLKLWTPARAPADRSDTRT